MSEIIVAFRPLFPTGAFGAGGEGSWQWTRWCGAGFAGLAVPTAVAVVLVDARASMSLPCCRAPVAKDPGQHGASIQMLRPSGRMMKKHKKKRGRKKERRKSPRSKEDETKGLITNSADPN